MRFNTELEKRAVWAWRFKGSSLISKAWEARIGGDTERARRLVKGALAGSPKVLVDTAIADVLGAPVMERRGVGVRVKIGGQVVSETSWSWPADEEVE